MMKFNAGPEFEYNGLSNIKNGKYTRYRDYIPLKDGIKIAVTILTTENSSVKKKSYYFTF